MKASRYWSINCPTFYVASVKPSIHKQGASGDWGYSTKYNDAIDLTPYEQKRFNADCNHVGVKANFLNY